MGCHLTWVLGAVSGVEMERWRRGCSRCKGDGAKVRGKSGWILGALGARERGPEQWSSVWADLDLLAQGLGCLISGSGEPLKFWVEADGGRGRWGSCGGSLGRRG